MKKSSLKSYDKREDWKDVVPIPQEDGENPVVPILYSKEYKMAMNYFRAVFHKKEVSDRAFDLVTHIIELNPANYTAWYYRRILLAGLHKNLSKEILYLDDVIEDNEKNYQVWYHRQKIMEIHFRFDMHKREKDFLKKMLLSDSKNYHCWSYRQWLVRSFQLWDGELEFVDYMIERDVRNNSAWNYRFNVFFHTTNFGANIRMKELEFAFKHISTAPDNEAPWNYCKGLLNYGYYDNQIAVLNKLEKLARERMEKYFNNRHLLYCIMLINSYFPRDVKRVDETIDICKSLIKIDNIRRNYWEFQLNKIINENNKPM